MEWLVILTIIILIAVLIYLYISGDGSFISDSRNSIPVPPELPPE